MKYSTAFSRSILSHEDQPRGVVIGPFTDTSDVVAPLRVLASSYINKIITWQIAKPLLAYEAKPPLHPIIVWGNRRVYFPIWIGKLIILSAPREPTTSLEIPAEFTHALNPDNLRSSGAPDAESPEF